MTDPQNDAWACVLRMALNGDIRMAPDEERPDPFAILEQLGLPEIAAPLRRLAQTRPDLDPLAALRADGFDSLADRLSVLCQDPAAMTAEGPQAS